MKSPRQISVGFLRALLPLLGADRTYKGIQRKCEQFITGKDKVVELLFQEGRFLHLGKFCAKRFFFILLTPPLRWPLHNHSSFTFLAAFRHFGCLKCVGLNLGHSKPKVAARAAWKNDTFASCMAWGETMTMCGQNFNLISWVLAFSTLRTRQLDTCEKLYFYWLRYVTDVHSHFNAHLCRDLGPQPGVFYRCNRFLRVAVNMHVQHQSTEGSSQVTWQLFVGHTSKRVIENKKLWVADYTQWNACYAK